jgi:outer membrane protein
LIGVPAVHNALLDNFTVPQTLPTQTEFESRALANRQDLLAAQASVAAAKHSVDAAIGEYFPSVSFNAAGFLYREFYTDASKWNSILSVSLPIFTGGAIEADIRNAWSHLRQAALSESEARRNGLKEVQIAYVNLTTSVEKIKQITLQVSAAQDAYDQALSAYRNGLGINLDVLQAQDQLLNAKLSLSSASFDKTVFYLDLLRACSELAQVMQ